MPYFRPNILAMDGYTPGEQPQAGKFVKLNTNENPYPPPPGIRRAIDEVLERGLQRYPDPMANSFRLRPSTGCSIRIFTPSSKPKNSQTRHRCRASKRSEPC